MLSLLFVMRGSKNFTSSLAVQMLPSVPIDHCVRNEANETFGRRIHSFEWYKQLVSHHVSLFYAVKNSSISS